MNSFDVLWQFRHAFFDGLLVTTELLTLTAIGGTLAGLSLEWLSEHFEGAVRRAVDFVAFCVTAIPALVILFWLHYPAQALVGVVVPAFWTALATLLLINVFAVYRIVADAVKEFPKQYISTGLVCGLNRKDIFRYIELPLLLRAALPRWIDQQVVILQTSLFASLIGVEEIFRVAQRINSVVYHPVVIYTSMALIFLTTAGTAMYYSKVLRNRFHRDLSER
jgi:ABC-type amino acid transport system permease subunit